ncbi:MAG: hydantoinase/oxoprolinase family protein [Lachnospiraceae bacterium]|nr:hydantoinase/oxoprolinase family protein [Lachnospiraceae bacterium]
MLGIGIDTGGTYTDAVIYDMETKKILGSGKALTTKGELEVGIAGALDKLPRELVPKAELLALSTTLATNACVENKGSRAKLLMIGFDTAMIERLKEIYASYGFHDRSQFVVIDGKVENIFSHPYDPDWEDLEKRLEEYFSDCDAVGIVQKHPRANGGRFEKKAKKVLEKGLTVPVTLAYDISDEVDILKCCAGTMLNARLIPLLAEFISAIRHVMRDRGLHVPIAIVRSDGSLMSEEMARECPVETLLSGPAASVVGGGALADEDSAVIVDMGGTTTDVAIMREKEPVMASSGIHIGQWKTMVKGLYVDTFGLGGDSAVRFKDGELYVDTVRVIPISLLASEHPQVVGKLRDLAGQERFHGCWIHEFYVLLKDISGKNGYSEEEQRICGALRDGPLITMELAVIMDKDPHFLRTERLEEEGVIIKSGLTPTDMMVLKGDFTIYDSEAARAAVECLKRNVSILVGQIPDAVYDLVARKMYTNLGRILLGQRYPKQAGTFAGAEREMLLGWCYEQAKARVDGLCRTRTEECGLALTTCLPLIGVGAPVHVFLPRVAKLLGTRAVIPEYAGVANALGAISGRIVTRVLVRVKAEYRDGYCYGYSVYEDGERRLFEEYEEAEAFARNLAERQVYAKAARQGTSGKPDVALTVEKIKSSHDDAGVLFETLVSAVATDKFRTVKP